VKGFTLVELMLSVLILAILMTMIYGVVSSTIEAQNRIEEVTGGSEIGSAILAQIRQDLEGAFLPKNDEEYFVATDAKGGGGDRDRIDLVTSTVSYGAEREGDEAVFHSVNEVGYQLSENRRESGLGVLYRREDLFVDREPLRGGKLTEFYDRVVHFNLSFWNGEKWVKDWNNKRDGGKLPRAVQVELRILVTERNVKDHALNYLTTVTFPR
jgi:type II secretion system protein J